MDSRGERYIPAGNLLPDGQGTSTGQWVDASGTDGTAKVLSDGDFDDEIGAALLLPGATTTDSQIFQIGANSHTAIYSFDQTTDSGTWRAGPELPGPASGNSPAQLVADDAPAAVLPNANLLLALALLNGGPPASLWELNTTSFTFTQQTTANTAGLALSGTTNNTGLGTRA